MAMQPIPLPRVAEQVIDPKTGQFTPFFYRFMENLLRNLNESAIASDGSVQESLYDANTILKADTDNTPAALTVASSTIVGRKAAGTISAMSAAETRTVLGLDGTGLVATDGANAPANRTITGTSAEIDVANGSGVSGNPTLSLPTALTFTGKTVTGGTFNSGTFNATAQFQVAGTKVIGTQGAAVADASGGATVDAEARAAINTLLARLRTHGLIAT